MVVCVPSLAQHIPKPFHNAKGPSVRRRLLRRVRADSCEAESAATFITRTLITSTGLEAREHTRPYAISKRMASVSQEYVTALRALLTATMLATRCNLPPSPQAKCPFSHHFV